MGNAVLQVTSIQVPPGLWRRFRMRCLAEGRPAHRVMAELMTRYLATPVKVKKQAR